MGPWCKITHCEDHCIRLYIMKGSEMGSWYLITPCERLGNGAIVSNNTCEDNCIRLHIVKVRDMGS